VLPVALLAVVLAAVALARRHEMRGQAWWALWLGIAATACCGVWALWILAQLGDPAPLVTLP
jgi:uncharacterized membrane protein YhaH (DUF805 family)